MANRIDLHRELSLVLGSGNVYYEPPESVKLKYPCIIYSRERDSVRSADNKRYLKFPRWNLIVIEHDPDSDLADRLIEHFEFCDIDRRFHSDNLRHTALNLYY